MPSTCSIHIGRFIDYEMRGRYIWRVNLNTSIKIGDSKDRRTIGFKLQDDVQKK